MAPIQEQLIRETIAEVAHDPDVVGVLLQGSLARGDSYPGSDLDLFLLLRDGCHRPFRAEERSGIPVEWHSANLERAVAKMRANPMLVYGFLDGRVLRDDAGGMARLVRVAEEVKTAYRVSSEEREGILYWLQSARVKIRTASEAGDLLKAAFVTAATSWKVLEGVWSMNDLPMPPSGAVLAHRGDLARVPEGWDDLFKRSFLGDDTERIGAILTVMDWLLSQESV